MTTASLFAATFDSAFAKRSRKAKFFEVDQFRAFMKAFSDTKSGYHVEEFHGAKHQVQFTSNHSWMRKLAKCELCDVLLLVYSMRNGIEVRMTLLQAKRSLAFHQTNQAPNKGRIEPQQFRGNFEQWDLLSNRPSIYGVHSFDPPAALLSSAKLPSVGSFGVFFRKLNNDVEMFYASGDCVTFSHAPAGPGARQGQLKTTMGADSRRIKGLFEVTYSPTIKRFAEALYSLEIGTPIFTKNNQGTSRNRRQQDWVYGILTAYIDRGEGDTPLASELRDLLEPNLPLPHFGNLPNLVIIRGEQSNRRD